MPANSGYLKKKLEECMSRGLANEAYLAMMLRRTELFAFIPDLALT